MAEKSNNEKVKTGRAIWSGAINFGLVYIPVRLYSATESKTLDFDMLHKKDYSPIRYARFCKAEEKEVPYDEVVKGYEYEKDDYVALTNEDFQKANVKETKSISILDFANEDEIDSIYFEKPYYLEPQKGAEKAYTLLYEALRQSNKVGVAKFVIRNREHLGVIKPQNGVIILDQMRFSDEIRKPVGLKTAKEEVSKQEIEMALALINQLSKPFKPEEYKDTYINELKEIIEEKIHGKEPKPKGEAPKPTAVSDLMATLKESLKKERERQPTAVQNWGRS